MRAADVSIPMSTVVEATPGREAARVLAAQDLPGLIVVARVIDEAAAT